MGAQTLMHEAVEKSPQLDFSKKWLGISLMLHFLAAVLSAGYFDSDEHFQILEWLGARMGRSSYAGLAWEYPFRMRSWAQPTLYELPTRLLHLLGIQDPFVWAIGARLLTALIGWLSLVALVRCFDLWFEDRRWREWAVRLSCLFWFVPYLHARTSSENLSGSMFLLALCVYTLTPVSGFFRTRPALALSFVGVLLGFSFFTRYQMGFGLVGFGLWLITVEKARDKRLLWMSGALVLTLGLNLALDRWGFGRWSLTPWNYFEQTIIKGASAAIGRSPWDYYFRMLLEQIPPLGALLVVGTFAGWVARPRNVLSFTSMFFVASHCAIAHKEGRFIFPIATQIPAIATFGLAKLGNFRFPKPLRALVAVLLAFNCLVLLVVCLKPATAQIGFYESVYRHQPPIRDLYHSELDPYAPFSVPIGFYRPPGLVEHNYSSIADLRSHFRPDQDTWLFFENYELTGAAENLVSSCKLEYTTYPSILNHLTFLAGPRRFANRWSLFRCRL